MVLKKNEGDIKLQAPEFQVHVYILVLIQHLPHLNKQVTKVFLLYIKNITHQVPGI